MYLLNKNHFTDKEKDVLRLYNCFSNKNWKHQNLISIINFLANESSIFSLEFALNNIQMIKEQIELSEEVLDFSKVDFSKCGSVRNCLSNVSGLYNIYFSNIKNVDNIVNGQYDSDGDRFSFFSNLKDNHLNSIHIDNCHLNGDNDQNYNILNFNRNHYAKNIIINNSEIKFCNIYNSNYTLPIEKLLVKDSKLYIQSYYGRLCGDVNEKCESIEFINSTIIPCLFDGIFRSNSQKIKDISLPNIINEGNYKLTSTVNGFSNCLYLESINFNEFDTSELTNMERLFENCQSLLYITGLEDKTFNKITNISSMFKNCFKLNDIPNIFNTMTEVNNLSSLFHTCKSIREISLEMNIPKCNMWAMIYNNESLEKVDLSKIQIDTNRGTFEKINFHENLKYCPNLKEVHLGLMKCGIIFQMQDFTNSNNIKRIFIPKETNMGVANVDGWVNQNLGILQNCSKDCIIYTDADYNFDYDTQTPSGTKPNNWLDGFNNHNDGTGGVKGLTIIGNTASDNFFPQIPPQDSNNISSYIVKYRELDEYQEQIISGKSILKCYIANNSNVTFDNAKEAIQQNQVTEISYSDILKSYYKGNGKLDIKFKIQEYISVHKPKMILLDIADFQNNTKTINAFHLEQIGIDNPNIEGDIPSIDTSNDDDFNEVINGNSSGSSINIGQPNNGGDNSNNIQITDDDFEDLNSFIIEENGDLYITNGNKKIKITPDNYISLLKYLQKTSNSNLDNFAKDLLFMSMFSSVKYSLANHSLEYKIGYYLYNSYKINNLALNFRGNQPILLNKLNSTNQDKINNELAKKSYNLYLSLLGKWKEFYSKTEDDFKSLYNQSTFDLFTIDYSSDIPSIKRNKTSNLFPDWNWISGETYRESKSIIINRLKNQLSIDLWFL